MTPPFLTMLKNATVSYATWLAAGRPTRSAAMISQLFEFCQQCPTDKYKEHSTNIGRCEECGCYLKRVPGGLNKLELLTDGCPDGHWPAQVENDDDV